jgi:hypothetical protein
MDDFKVYSLSAINNELYIKSLENMISTIYDTLNADNFDKQKLIGILKPFVDEFQKPVAKVVSKRVHYTEPYYHTDDAGFPREYWGIFYTDPDTDETIWIDDRNTEALARAEADRLNGLSD